MTWSSRQLRSAAGLALALACSGEAAESESDAGGAPPACPDSGDPDKPERLCEWSLFVGDGATQEPAEGVIPYTVVSSLYTDDAHKRRFLKLPAGGQITHDPSAVWSFPEGTILIKTFAYPVDVRDPALGEHLVETRLLVKRGDRWEPFVYRWNADQDAAERFVPGARVDVSWIDADGATQAHQYRIPSTDDCKICHGGKGPAAPLGPRTRQLDTDYDHGDGPVNQIDHLDALGLLSTPPQPAAERERLVDPFGDAPLELRARSYLDANCAGCHREGGDAQSSGLWLNWENQDELHLGICKGPVAAGNGGGGLLFDIVPGSPDESIFVFRMESSAADIKMPELGGLQPDLAGAQLIRAWIAAMQPPGCDSDGA